MPAYRCKLSWSRGSFGRTFAACFLALVGFACRAQASITFVQQNSADPQTPQTSVAIPYTLGQTGGNLNVVVVGWNDSTATVGSVKDTSGNVYVLAVGPTIQSGTATQAIYYAKNISSAAASANTVTVTFTTAATYPDIRIAEYSGLDPVNPLDVAVGAQGNTANSSSGSVTTTNANDLLIGANLIQTLTTGPGSGYTSRVITNPDGDILQDRVVTATGSYSATAPVSPSGLWIMQIVAFRASSGTGGTQPTAPTNLTAVAAGPVQINLSWTASTETGGTISQYLVERCTGANCSSFVQIGTSTTTSYGDTGLLGSTSYSYRVRAADTANVTGPYSAVASAITAAPTLTAPANLAATAVGPVQVNLSWTAATETGGSITNYLVERCTGATCSNFVQIGSSATTSYSDTSSSLTGSTTYNYRVRATDAASNFSAYSNASSATTAAPTFTVPSNLAATPAGSTQISLSWTAGTETGGTITSYLVERCAGVNCANTPSNFAQVGSSATTTFSDTGLTPSTSYSYRARATDAAGNFSQYSNVATAATPASSPTAPGNLTATAAGPAQVNLAWTASTETGGTISQYLVERCTGANCSSFVQIGTSTTTSYGDTSLIGSTSYSYRVRAADTSNVNGPYSAIASATTAAPTFTSPASLAASAAGPVQVNLSWTAATETGGTITNYLVERCTGATCSNFAQIGSSATTSYSDTSSSLTGSTTYNYRVRATDAASNFSAYSNTASATTAAPTFIAPSSLSATAPGSTQINLSWAAGTETGGTISSYLVERCAGVNCANTPSSFAQVGSSATTTFSDTGLTPSTSYSYRVRATDAASNFSPYSNVATGATTAPPPSLSTLSLTQGPVGASVTISGSNFGATQGSSTVTFNGTTATATAWSSTSIDTTVPAGTTTGNVVVTVGGSASNGLPFTLTPPPSITTVNPNAGPIGTVVNVSGANFGPTVGTRNSNLLFNGIAARTTSWSDTLIVAPVPAAATSGNVVVSVGGVNSNGMPYTVTPGPNIASLSPTAGAVGTSITINGAGFGASQGTSTITFNGTAATPTGWSDTSIVAPVPSGATTGNVVVTAGGIASNGVPFTVNASSSIKLVQHASKDAGTTTSASLAFTSNNAAGNFIAVVIRAGRSGQVFTVSDSRGNTYKKAITFNMTVDPNTMGIYYAENISAGANTITVSDTISGTLRFAIMEYSGVATLNSIDATAVSQGTSVSPNSGTATTSLSGDLLLGEIVTADPATFTSGTGYQIQDFVPAEPNTKLVTEDQLQTVVGSASATATLSASDPWGAALVAFKSASGTPPPPISVSVSPTAASVGTGSGVQTFTATVQNDFRNGGVTWSLSGAGCSGNTCGTLSNISPTTVTYSGPTSIPNPATVTLTATSVSDTTKTGTATITVVQGTLGVSVSPKRAAVTMSALQTVQFTGTVTNDPSNSGVTWSVDGNNGGSATTGTISATGLYTPGTQPGVHTITATSAANASVNASSSVAVTDLAGVYTHHNDVQRTGQNLKEYALTPANVGSSAFARLFSCPADGYVYAQPLWIANLSVGGANHNVVFIATEHDSVYAYDADSPSCVLLWKTSFLSPGVTTMPYTDITPNPTDDVFPEIGITSTPVIDPATNTIYVVAKTKETVGTGCSSGSPCYVNRLHALDITAGAEKFGGPRVISATGFVAYRHFNRPALLLANGVVYVALGSHGDNCNWQGWIFGYNATTLAQNFVWNTADPNTCSGGGIWQGGAGPAADANGNIYFSTGNGTYDGKSNFGDTAVKLSAGGTLLDWFTPFNESTFKANDIDLASAGIMILPDSVGSAAHPHLALATGKVAILYLLDQNSMGKFNSTTNNDVQEVIPVPPPNTTQLDGGIYGLPAYWNGNIYTTGQNFPLSQFTIANGVMATPQVAKSTNLFPPRGATPGVSASGNTNGVVWILDLTAWPSSGNAILDAYDATNVSNLLFSSPSSGASAAGPAVKFTVPTVANGKVYVGGQSTITVFGLLPN